MIHVIATITVAPGRRADFLQEFHRLVPQVLAEDGCVEYGPTIDFPTGGPMQQLAGADAVVVVEKWRDLPALQAHLIAPHVEAYRQRVAPLIRDVRLLVLQPA